MCGIAGILKVNEAITAEQIKALLLGVQHRGGDATGVALMNGNDMHYIKKDKIAWQFCTDREFEAFLEQYLNQETDVVILHTRAATKGLPYKNMNNHPLTIGRAAIVHNGVIHNDDELFRDLKLERHAETDSDIIRAILDEEGITPKGIRVLNRMRGSCATAAISPDYPGKLLLARSGSPLVLGHTGGQLLWASVKDPIHKAARTWEKWRGIWFQATKPKLMFSPVVASKAFIIDIPRFREDANYTPWEGEFDTCKQYTPPTYKVHENHADKQKRFQEAKARESKSDSEGADTQANTATSNKSNTSGRTETTEVKFEANAINGPALVCYGNPGPDMTDYVECNTHKMVHFKRGQHCPMCKTAQERYRVDHNLEHCEKHNISFNKGTQCIQCKVQGNYVHASQSRVMRLRAGEKVECPNAECGKLFEIDKKTEGLSLYELECTECHTLLGTVPDDTVN